MVHIVFSTRNRANLITPAIEPDLYKYISGTLRKMESPCLTIGGSANHLHLLVSQSKNIALAFLLEELKKSSSKWIKHQDASFRSFKWHGGYGAFTIGQSNVAALKRYYLSRLRREESRRRSSR